jgi:hypothetical protein
MDNSFGAGEASARVHSINTFIRIAIYPYIMPKQKITISLDSEIAKQLRIKSIEKYGDGRSLSRLIEDLATGAAQMENETKEPDACSILGHRTEYSFKAEAEFKEAVEEITNQLPKMITLNKFPISSPSMYFALKEACELRMNQIADEVNSCYTCKGLNAPLPKYPDVGRNFAIYATMDSNLR